MAKKTKENKSVRCLDCANAQIHQWKQNPLIAFCFGSSQKRNVARSLILCPQFKARIKPVKDYEIIHHE